MQGTIKLNEVSDKRYALWLLRSIEQNIINVRPSVYIEDSKEYATEYCKKNNCILNGNHQSDVQTKERAGAILCQWFQPSKVAKRCKTHSMF